MKFRNALFLLLFLLLTIFGCSRHNSFLDRLDRLDSLVSDRPDSVLRVLETLADSVDVQPESVRMRYALLKVKAEDKAYISHSDDSLILSVAQYYERHTDERLTPEALYYVGRVHADMGDAPQALDDFQKALDACNSSDSDETKHIRSVLHSQMGNLYSMQQQYTKSNANYKLAYHYDSLLNDTVGMIYDLRDYAHSFYYQMLFDSAQYYYREVDSLANLYGDERMKAMVVVQEAAIEVYVGNNERAIELIRSALPLIHENVRGGAYSTLADNNHGYGQDILKWFEISSHEVGHLKQIEQEQNIVKYVGRFVYEYISSCNHDDEKSEREADYGRLSFIQFRNFVSKEYGKTYLEDIFRNNESEVIKIKMIDQLWSNYKNSFRRND